MVSDRIRGVDPGDDIQIRGHTFHVGSKTIRSNTDRMLSLGVMAVDMEPLTHQTVSKLDVTQTPFILDVCNGGTHEIAPDEVEV